MNDSYKLTTILRLISGVLLILAIGNHPYSYFIFLRWIVSTTSFYTGWFYSQVKNIAWSWAFFIIGVFFNPIIPFYLDKTTWQIIDLIVAILFFVSFSQRYKNAED